MQIRFKWLKGFLSVLPFTVTFLITGLVTENIHAQHTIEVRIDKGFATSTCRDGLDNQAEPKWEVSIENGAYMIYDNDCFASVPNTQFSETVECPGDLRGGEIQVCLRVFENDAGIFSPCEIDRDCEETICDLFVLPIVGQDSMYELSIPDSLSSGGTVSFTISVAGTQDIAPNDHICHTIDLGTLSEGDTLGNINRSQYNNYCATAINEVNPKSVSSNASFTNNVGVWFSFNTGDNPSELILIESLSDPEELGDPLNLQLAVYQSNTDDCNGELQLIADHHDPSDEDEFLLLECLPPNQTYYILLDGVYIENSAPDFPLLWGLFSISVREISVTGNNDQICEAASLPIIEEETTSYTNFFNNCATNTNDPTIDNFPSFQPVWFQFQPPTSRRLQIAVIGNESYPNGIDPILPQIAVFETTDTTCAGDLNRLGHHYDSDSRINTIELDCLDPTKTYWLMVDGNEEEPTGIFDIQLTDLGYPEPSILDTVICQGEAFVLGNQTYTAAGTYLDTIIFLGGCLEIIETTIQEVDSLGVTVDFPKIAGGIDIDDGIAELTISGGSGNYEVAWSDGRNTLTGNDLIGGETYCVTVFDRIGCEDNICFEMPYVVPIQANLKNDTLDCFGDTDGQLLLSIENGQPPYEYALYNAENQMLEQGIVEAQTVNLIFKDLKADDYSIVINTENAISTLTGKVESPNPIAIRMLNKNDASCFNSCDGSIELLAEGGNGVLQLYRENDDGNEFIGDNLCAGKYGIVAIDEKNCRELFEFEITEPTEFIAEATQMNPVRCFREDNGAANVTTNGNPILYEWDNGMNEPLVINLQAGTHTVTVTNEDNCKDTAQVLISQPDALLADIEVLSVINCFGDNNGMLEGRGIGGNGGYEYTWSNNLTTTLNDNLSAGNYEVTITDALGCTATTNFLLEQPTELTASITTEDVNCPQGFNSGRIIIENTSGGTMPYAYRTATTTFTDFPQLEQLAAGNYEVIVQDANGCEWSQMAVINAPPTLTLNLGEDQNIQLGESITLEAITNHPVQYEWSDIGDNNCDTCSSLTLNPLRSTRYSVTVTDTASACTATDEVFIAIRNDREVFVPNVFSPNGDGNNDFLMVYGGNTINTIKQFKVFDRNGTLVYEANNFLPNDPTTSWNGDFNGQQLASSVFIYWAEVEFIDGYSEVFKGDIALMR